jgi:NTE family protein
MRALVLSGGGLFGAWQAGAWSVLAGCVEPDLIVGASVGSLNGYAIACGASPEELCGMWRDAQFRDFGRLHQNLRMMTDRYTLRRPFALTVTDALTLKVRVYRDGEITWKHLAASCALPLVLPQVRLEGRWMSDGGLLQSLPVRAALDLGATSILALDVLRPYPAPAWVVPMVRGFQTMFGPSRDIPATVRMTVLSPSRRLGGLKDSARATEGQVERWLEQGAEDAEVLRSQKPFPL